MNRPGQDVVNIYITTRQKEALKDLAWKNHTTVSGLLRNLIEMALETPAKELPGKIAEDVYQPTREDFYKEIERDVNLLRKMDLFELQRGGSL